MFVWTIPDELCTFINREFLRFQAPFPSERSLNEVGDYVLNYVAQKNYFPRSYEEYEWRYNNPSSGLTEPEKQALIASIEYKLKVNLLETITFDQLHLAVWAALMWCWSEKGVPYVQYYQETAKKDLAFSSDYSRTRH